MGQAPIPQKGRLSNRAKSRRSNSAAPRSARSPFRSVGSGRMNSAFPRTPKTRSGSNGPIPPKAPGRRFPKIGRPVGTGSGSMPPPNMPNRSTCARSAWTRPARKRLTRFPRRSTFRSSSSSTESFRQLLKLRTLRAPSPTFPSKRRPRPTRRSTLGLRNRKGIEKKPSSPRSPKSKSRSSIKRRRFLKRRKSPPRRLPPRRTPSPQFRIPPQRPPRPPFRTQRTRRAPQCKIRAPHRRPIRAD